MREMRRKNRQITPKETEAILEKGIYGTLAMVDDGRGVAAVPLSYVWHSGNIYFHSAMKGHKVDNLRQDGRVCFTVVGDVQAVYIDDFTTYYESAIVYGRAEPVTDRQEKSDALMALCKKYLAERIQYAPRDIEKYDKSTAVYRLVSEGISGKAHRAAR